MKATFASAGCSTLRIFFRWGCAEVATSLPSAMADRVVMIDLRKDQNCKAGARPYKRCANQLGKVLYESVRSRDFGQYLLYEGITSGITSRVPQNQTPMTPVPAPWQFPREPELESTIYAKIANFRSKGCQKEESRSWGRAFRSRPRRDLANFRFGFVFLSIFEHVGQIRDIRMIDFWSFDDCLMIFQDYIFCHFHFFCILGSAGRAEPLKL